MPLDIPLLSKLNKYIKLFNFCLNDDCASFKMVSIKK